MLGEAVSVTASFIAVGCVVVGSSRWKWISVSSYLRAFPFSAAYFEHVSDELSEEGLMLPKTGHVNLGTDKQLSP